MNPSSYVPDAATGDLTGAVEEPRAEGARKVPLFGFRRNLLINPHYQLRALALPTLLSVGTVTVLLFALFRVMLASSLDTSSAAASLWQTQESRWLLNSLAGAFGFAALLVFVGVLETHRAAGAIFKMQRHLNRVADGKLDSKVFLRKHDHFQDVADDFNRMVDNLREEARMDLRQVNQAIEAIGQVRPTETDGASSRLARAWDALVDLKHRKETSAR